ncbi:MAG: cytochrome d ubiquinol oxidase subunit II [Thermoleophilia bacterium]
MSLETLWFTLIAVLWCGYFVLEGFDFGVGMLLRLVGRNGDERRAVIHTIGPVWDGNEVWLLVAGGATFAAFPEWYATLFSGFYLPLLLILVALIARGVAFEFRGKHDDPKWRDLWDWVIVVGSALPALLWGVAFANIVRGVPIDASGTYTGGFFNLLNPYALAAGLTTVALFAALGAIYLSLKTKGVLLERSRAYARMLGPVAGVLLIAAAALTMLQSDGVSAGELVSEALLILAGAALAVLSRGPSSGRAFIAGAAGAVFLVVALMVELFPNVMPSSTSEAFNLTLANASSTHYTLVVMTVVAAVFTPIVLAYQAWTYWVFRHRVGIDDVAPTNPLDVLGHHRQGGAA